MKRSRSQSYIIFTKDVETVHYKAVVIFFPNNFYILCLQITYTAFLSLGVLSDFSCRVGTVTRVMFTLFNSNDTRRKSSFCLA